MYDVRTVEVANMVKGFLTMADIGQLAFRPVLRLLKLHRCNQDDTTFDIIRSGG